ncbi:MAG: Crp/Fnr family transcriptional regulator [Candidatus Hydrogenedentes bacterium]|nr:Crp/Fnr family transcriptional regulator [Candidatus Hydrogenedentota bacterium]
MDRIAAIAAAPLFRGLSDEHHKRLASRAVEREVGRGETIFAEGEEADGFYLVVTGQVRVFKLSEEGKEQTLHIFGPGAPFGEVAVFAGSRFPAHAAALKRSRILFFPRHAFVELVHDDPSLALNMLAILSKRLTRFTALIEDLSLKEVPARFAAYLLFLSEQQGAADVVAWGMAKGQLANLLGTTPETFSRILRKLAERGAVEPAGAKGLRLLDRAYLGSLSTGRERLA